MKTHATALALVLDYFNNWSAASFDVAESLLADDLRVIVPINSYAERKDFMNAVKYTRGVVTDVTLESSFEQGREAVLIYTMQIPAFGELKIAEHFIVHEGRIVQITQIHDTAPFRN